VEKTAKTKSKQIEGTESRAVSFLCLKVANLGSNTHTHYKIMHKHHTTSFAFFIFHWIIASLPILRNALQALFFGENSTSREGDESTQRSPTWLCFRPRDTPRKGRTLLVLRWLENIFREESYAELLATCFIFTRDSHRFLYATQTNLLVLARRRDSNID
jgi:hypothetical protein